MFFTLNPIPISFYSLGIIGKTSDKRKFGFLLLLFVGFGFLVFVFGNKINIWFVCLKKTKKLLHRNEILSWNKAEFWNILLSSHLI